MMYIDPYLDTITVEFRRYREDKNPARASSWQWKLRNLVWSELAPHFSYLVTKYVPIKTPRYFLINASPRSTSPAATTASPSASSTRTTV